MEKEKRVRLIYAGIILAAIIACGVIGYLNRPGAISDDSSSKQTATAITNPVKELKYCTESARLCIISFGLDNTGNMLIILKNNGPTTGIYAQITQQGTEFLYECQKVDFGVDTYYCLGTPVSDQSTVKMEVFAKGSNLLLAKGEFPVQFGATPAVFATKKPESTATIQAVQPTKAMISPTPVPGTAQPISTAYPNPTPYP